MRETTMGTAVPVEPPTTLRRIAPAVGLFFLSPLIAEYLLGNISISALVGLVFVAPLYGGGALLIREVTRRAGRGWPTMLLLGLAYGVIEEGLVSQTLFNPSYFGYDLLSVTHLPALGMGAWWTVFVLTLHTVWSTSASIALVEALVPARSTAPWTGAPGLAVAAVMFTLGAVGNAFATYDTEHFVASTPQLTWTVVVAVALVVVAFAVGRHRPPRSGGSAPDPWLVGAVSLGACVLFKIGRYHPGWLAVGGWLTLYFVVIVLVMRWSLRQGWGARHRFAMAGGAVLVYGANAFLEDPIIGATGTVDLIGNTVLGLGTIALLVTAARILRASPGAP